MSPQIANDWTVNKHFDRHQYIDLVIIVYSLVASPWPGFSLKRGNVAPDR